MRPGVSDRLFRRPNRSSLIPDHAHDGTQAPTEPPAHAAPAGVRPRSPPAHENLDSPFAISPMATWLQRCQLRLEGHATRAHGQVLGSGEGTAIVVAEHHDRGGSGVISGYEGRHAGVRQRRGRGLHDVARRNRAHRLDSAGQFTERSVSIEGTTTEPMWGLDSGARPGPSRAWQVQAVGRRHRQRPVRTLRPGRCGGPGSPARPDLRGERRLWVPAGARCRFNDGLAGRTLGIRARRYGRIVTLAWVAAGI